MMMEMVTDVNGDNGNCCGGSLMIIMMMAAQGGRLDDDHASRYFNECGVTYYLLTTVICEYGKDKESDDGGIVP